MRSVAEALSTTEATRARTAKVAALSAALVDVAARAPERLAFVARFLSGTLLPTDDERTLGAGGALVFEAASAATGEDPSTLGARARRLGDLGSAVWEALSAREHAGLGLTIEDAENVVHTLASSGSRAQKTAALSAALQRASALEARYLVRAILGEMRVGAREGIVEDAIAKAFGRTLADVRLAGGLLADVGELARLAHADRLGEASIRLGRPIGFMLATPIESARGADLGQPHAVEDKIDGIRAQAHVGPDGVHLFARGKGAVTTAFPDVAEPLLAAVRAGSVKSAILDGEIVVMTADGRPRPFSAIQPRLKKLAPDDALLHDHPARYLVYDLLFEDGESLLALPFLERRARLVAWAKDAPVAVHESRPLVITDDDRSQVLDAAFDQARARGFEGLVLKRLDAVYAAGVRGFAWLKVKKALATLDVVVVGAEYGSGKRAGSLSDYTFAVRAGDALLTIGRAYSGLTDAEIATMTERLLSIRIDDPELARGQRKGFLPVRPEIVLEIAFDGLQRSQRHSSGFALRFPRIARIRDDKTVQEIDTVDAVQALWDAQLASGHREEGAPKPRARKSGYRPDVRVKSKQLRLFDDD